MLRSYVVIALRNLMRDKLHGSSRYNQIKNSEFVLRKLYLPLLNAPLFRCKSGEGTNSRVVWRQMDSCNLPARDGQPLGTLGPIERR